MAGRSAIVVGGGIGGLATAVGLVRAGWSVRVLEQAAEFAEVGAGISLWANAFRALDALGLGDRVRALGTMDVSGGARDRRGRQLLRTDTSELARRHGASAVLLHRADLLSALGAALPQECLVAGARVHDVRAERGRVVVAHGEQESTVDLLVGADGVHSVVRSQMWTLAPPPRYAGHTAWRMIVPAPAGIPLHGSESWGPGSVFGIFPMAGDRVYCYATAALPPGRMSAGGELAALRGRFGDWHEPIPALLAAATEEAVLRNDIYYLPPLDTYIRDRAALVGDAAHAMTPNLGQGACQALEDAATLAVLLGSESDVDVALRRYDALRRPRSQAIALRSRRTGAMAQLRSPVMIGLRNAVLRLVPSPVLLRSMSRVLDWRPPRADHTGRVLT
jgi:2-polyprenyl-6-methoxyphenol hydroxylase-like FAD-dependent oxidoreductase